MAEPQLVPPTPTINQGDSPQEIERVTKSFQDAFDRAAPRVRGSPTTPEPPAAPPPQQPPPETQPELPIPAEQPVPVAEPSAPPVAPEPERKMPSFLEEVLSVDKPPPPPAPPEEVFPEEMPVLKNAEEVRSRYHTWRDKYQELKDENKRLRERPAVDEATTQKLAFLEEQNKKLSGRVSQIDVETNQEFQQKVLGPMQRAWGEAVRVVQEAGGDPNSLAQALALSGKAQYQALDELFMDMPESAKAEANNAISVYRRYDDVRRKALANAPRTAMELRKKDLERQMTFLNKQKQEMGTLFEDAVRRLREEAGVEVLRKTNDPQTKWWDDQAEELVSTARSLYLDNADLGRMAMACVLAPMADTYRKLWFSERDARLKAEAILKDKYGAEPSLSESGGAAPVPGSSRLSEDLKRPFSDVFLEKFHQLRAQGR